jgi:nucleotide-binding universal stress UspA family protein
MQSVARNLYGKILVTTDFSADSWAAFPYARSEAQPGCSQLILLHALSGLDAGIPFKEYLPSIKAIEEIKERALGVAKVKLEALAREHFAGLSAQIEILTGSGNTGDLVSEYSKQHSIGLIVLARHGYGALTRAVLGSVAERILRRAPCPILVVPPTPPGAGGIEQTHWKRVLFATDFSASAACAMPFARYESQRSGAQLTVVHTIQGLFAPELLYSPGTPPITNATEIQERYRKGVEIRLEEVVKQIDLSGCDCKLLDKNVSTSQSILGFAEQTKADLIVVGSKGAGEGFHLLGSVAERILRHASCPVLLVPNAE